MAPQSYAQPASHPSETEPANPPIRVAIVEDDDADFFLTRRILEKTPHQTFAITRADSFDSGLALLQAQRFDIALIDYRLGASTGLDLVRALGGRNSPTPCIMFSGVADRQVDLAAMEAGAMDFVDKAELFPERLERTLRYACDINQTLVELRNAYDSVKPADGETIASLGQTRHDTFPESHVRDYEPLTRRECEIAAQIAGGASNKEVASPRGSTSAGGRSKVTALTS